MVALSRGTKAAATLPAEKQSAALGSVVAACFLTAAKLIVGVVTGSLGMLSEAAHSGLDLAATVVTYLSVRASGRPADQTHQFGHGKVENLSAFVETTLLLLTSAWIVLEAVRRLVPRRARRSVPVGIWRAVALDHRERGASACPISGGEEVQ